MLKCDLLITAASLIILNVLLLTVVLVKAFTRVGCPSANIDVSQMERIVGGRPVGIDKFRFMSSIIVVYQGSALQCGSSIISTYWVISAAHCVELMNDHPLSAIYVASGHKEWKQAKRHKVERMLKHPAYNGTILSNDSALLKVKEPFDMNTEVPIALVDPKYVYKINSSATVIGWGANVTGSLLTQKTLLAVDVVIFSQDYCNKMWQKRDITADMFCAGTYEGGRDACQFDSGGPIIQKGILIGIISWGGECGDKKQPGVFGRMSYFIPWLKNVEKEENIKIGYNVKSSNV